MAKADAMSWAKDRPVFVIQKHDATTLHYDFRIEVDGVLKSWAVPKGPSMDPEDKRLAMPTEDHRLSYGDFEGVIPEGEYGAGKVLLWDRGSYRNLKENKVSVARQLEQGEVTIFLEGQKISGGFALVRTDQQNKDDREKWLLIKMDDDHADARRNPVSTQTASVKSGKELEEIANEH
ncbi:MAG: DNA polymerase ligase N-terminal domain-containing protein [Ketobacteraceae bacterium]|nr:DNA polymerase ligase N-terminal domain-containing protein [Ketobacteraceae bacterium]